MLYPIGLEADQRLASVGCTVRRRSPGGPLSAFELKAIFDIFWSAITSAEPASAQTKMAEIGFDARYASAFHVTQVLHRLLIEICEKHPQVGLTCPADIPPTVVPDLPPEPVQMPEPEGGQPNLSIVTGTFNRLSFLRDMIGSVRQHAGPVSYRIIIIDGGSTDGTQRWVEEQPECLLIQQNGPLTGAVRAFNLGFGCAVDLGTPYVAHLNDDIVLQTPDMLYRACEILKHNSRVGEVAFAFDLRGPHDFESVHHHLYANFGVIRREAGMEVARAQGDQAGKNWWNLIYRTYGADSELGCWLWRLKWTIYGDPGLRVHDRTPETQDVLRQANGSNDPNREDAKIFWRRWPTSDHVLHLGPVT